jgi:hypothetical protein
MYSAAQWQLPDWLTEVDGITGNFTSDKFTRSPFLPLSDRRRKAPPHSMKCNASNYKHVGDNRLVILLRWACDTKCIGPIEAPIRNGGYSLVFLQPIEPTNLTCPVCRNGTHQQQGCRLQRNSYADVTRYGRAYESSRYCSENQNKKIKILQLPAMSVWAMY